MGRVLTGTTACGLVDSWSSPPLPPLLTKPDSFTLIFFSEEHSSTCDLLVSSLRRGSFRALAVDKKYRLVHEPFS